MQVLTFYKPASRPHAGPPNQESRVLVMAGRPVEDRYVIPS
jgi:hypothetical protein